MTSIAPHLRRFESIAAKVAMEVYGRVPSKIVHAGTYNCRRIRRYPDLLSEHGIGNAIDVKGFDFSRAKTDAEKAANPEKRLRRAFSVRLDKDWNQTKGVAKKHARFLRRLTEELLREDVFRVLLGPAYPGHQDHFHFDLAPYRLVQL